MTYEELINNVGNRIDIVGGDLVFDDEGFLTVSDVMALNTVYVNKVDRSYNPVVPKNELRGKEYRLQKKDCISLVLDYYDENFGTDFASVYRNLDRATFKAYQKDITVWFAENNFYEVAKEDAQDNDVLMYDYNHTDNRRHLGLYLGDKIYHHMPRKYSCADVPEWDLVLGVYRYAN